MSRRVRWLGPLLALGILFVGHPARGEEPDELARKHFESGVAYLQESDYENALKAFEKSYELSKRPEILLNIATVNERRNDLEAAIAALEKFLATAGKDSDQRATTEVRLANLKKRLAGNAKPPPETGPPSESTTTPPPETEVTPVPTGEEDKPNIPAYVLLGVGAITAGGAILTGILAKGEYDDAKSSCSPSCADSDLQAGRTLALTSTILTGVAVVSASVGAVLFFTAKSKSDKDARLRPKPFAPRVFVGVTPSGASAAAHWQF